MHTTSTSLLTLLSENLRYMASRTPQMRKQQMAAIFLVDFQRIFWWRLINSSFRYSNPLRLLVMERSAEMVFSLAVLATCFAASIWFNIWASSSWLISR